MHYNHDQQRMNERGVALVMVLILSLIGLAIVSALLYLVTQGTTMSGAMRFYRSAEEASVGTAEILTDYFQNRGVLNIIGAPYASGCNCGDPLDPDDNTDGSAGNARTCRCDRLCNATADWDVALCDENGGVAGIQVDLNPRINPDLGNNLNPILFGDYRVYVKIVDTVRGNSDIGGITAPGELGGQGVVSSTSGVVSPPAAPYLYRAEILAENATNPRENSRMSVLYAY